MRRTSSTTLFLNPKATFACLELPHPMLAIGLTLPGLNPWKNRSRPFEGAGPLGMILSSTEEQEMAVTLVEAGG